MLLPGPKDKCPICAVDHLDVEPHDATSLYYMFRFFGVRGRSPTWADAIAHCPPNIRAAWERELRRQKHWTQPPHGVELIADPPAESIRQPIGDIASRTFGPTKEELE